MMPVDLGQLSQTQPRGQSQTADADPGGFEELLNQVQSLQWTALARTSARGSSFVQVQEGTAGQSRESRINQETQSARQAEVSASRTRGADPSSVQGGVVSQRHERVLAQKATVGETQKPPEPKTATGPHLGQPTGHSASKGASQSRPFSQFQNVPYASRTTEHANTTSTPTNDPVAPETKPASDPQQPSPIRAVPKSEPTANVGASAAVMTDKQGNRATSAERVGQLLAGKAQGDVSRTTPTSPAVHAGRNDTQKNSRQAVGNKARAATSTRGRGSADETGATKRSIFEGLVKSIRMNHGAKSTSATIRLNPPELGQMKIHAHMSDDILKVRVEASSDAARGMLAERSDELVSALRERGIHVDRFEVLHVDSFDNDLRDANGQAGNGFDLPETMHDSGQPKSDQSAEGDDAAAVPSELDSHDELETSVGLNARLDVRI